MTLAQKVAEIATCLTCRDLLPDGVYHAKHVLLDNLACAIGGYDREAGEAIKTYIQTSEQPEEQQGK